MKTNAIIRIVIWSIVLAALIGVLVFFLAGTPFSRSTSIEATAVPIELEETPVHILPNEETLTFPEAITDIEISWVAGDILIMAKDVAEITVSESDVTDHQYSLVWQVRNGKLEIDFCEDTLTSGIGISFGKETASKDLYIYVPMDWNGNSIEIDAAATNVEMQGLILREMDFDGASGTCDFVNCQIGDLDIDTASGDVTFSGTLDTLDFDAASASFIGELSNVPSRIDMDGMSGSLDITLPEDCGYTLTMDGMSSSFHSDFQETQTKNKSHIYGDGRCRINVDGMSCDVTIRKAAAVAPTEETPEPCTDPNCTIPEEHWHSTREETFSRPACSAADCTDPAHEH